MSARHPETPQDPARLSLRQSIDQAVKALLDAQAAVIDSGVVRKIVITIECSPDGREVRDKYCAVVAGERRRAS